MLSAMQEVLASYLASILGKVNYYTFKRLIHSTRKKDDTYLFTHIPIEWENKLRCMTGWTFTRPHPEKTSAKCSANFHVLHSTVSCSPSCHLGSQKHPVLITSFDVAQTRNNSWISLEPYEVSLKTSCLTKWRTNCPWLTAANTDHRKNVIKVPKGI